VSRAETARRALGLVDLTSLNDDDTAERIADLCEQAVTPAGSVAAVCVYGRWVRQAADALRGSGVRVAAVANFPAGAPDPAGARREAEAELADGADEVDVVLPFAAYAAGDRADALEVVRACREASTGAVLKVILETGALREPALIRAAAADALAEGADFVKTSTGKRSPGATPEAARLMLEAIRDAGHGGFKASGGVRTVEDAAGYLQLADELLGPEWASPATFRFGASGLLGALLDVLGAGGADPPPTSGY
jgi:deoxyribose-phosphate aldolase